MSRDTFFPKRSLTNFTVKNLSNKRIRIFNYPLNPGESRDLLNIPEISESDIRHSLLKGMLFDKIVVGDIEISPSTDIDLLQFNADQKAFLQAAGVVIGLDGYDGYSGGVPTTRLLIAGTGMTGGGDLSADRTFNVVANVDGSIIANADNIQVGILATDVQHGNRGGGPLHTVCTPFFDGFMSSGDKTKLDSITVANIPTATEKAALIGTSGVPSAINPYVTNTDARLTDARSPTLHATTHSPNTGTDPLVTGVPVDIGVANAPGAADSFSRSDHIHNTPFSAVQNALAFASSAVSINAQQVSSIALVPLNPGDAASKSYVDLLAIGIDWKDAVRATTTGSNIVLAGLLTLDTIVLNPGDRVLVKDQTTQSENGFYSASAGAWARTTDLPAASVLTRAIAVFVTEGFTYGSTGWVSTSMPPITIGTDPFNFAQFTGLGQINAGAGLTKTGDTLDVGAPVDGSILVAADFIQVGVLATDAQHGNRGNGALHAIATPALDGFLSAADKTKLNAVILANLPTANEKAALAGTAGVPSGINPYVTDVDARLTDARTPLAHAATHLPSGTDPLTIGMPVDIGTANAAGSADSFSRSDHIHNTPFSAVQNALAAATSAISVNGQKITSLGTPTLAADATTKAYVDGAAAAILGVAIPVADDAGAGSAGVALFASREDHKHSITVGVPVSVGTANAAGASTSLSRSDHIHDHGVQPSGAGTQHALVTIAVAGFMSAADKTKLDGLPVSAVPTTRIITAGTGLTGGGDLSADRTFDVVANADGSIIANANDIQVGILATDAQHGVRGGGTQHSLVVPAGAAGFMSGTDKTKLDGIATGAAAVGSSVPVAVDASAGVVGTATVSSREDHKHQVSVGVPVNVGIANSAGVSSSLARADHIHNTPFSAVQTALGAATGSISVNSQLITNVLTPVSSTDAATKGYVDLLAVGVSWKTSVVAATTAAIVLSAPQVVDGVALVAGNRCLVKNQASAIANGLYIVAAGAWTRAADLPAAAVLSASFAVFVEQGTTNADSGWILTSNPPLTVGTDPLNFTQFTALGQITAGAGLTKTGSTLDVGANPDGSITVNANNIQVGILASDAQHGVRGGGTQHAVVIPAGAAGFMSGADKTKLDGLPSSAVPTTRNLIAGTGLTGGGDLSADRTFNVVANADGSIIANANDIQVGILATDAQHGVRGGGTQHALVTIAVNGFMSAADKVKLNGIAVGATATPLGAAVPVAVDAGAGVVGVSTNASREDHKHSVSVGVPVAVGTANAAGAANTLSRSDHVHDHGAQPLGAGTQHAIATPAISGFLSAADKTKLNSITVANIPTANEKAALVGTSGAPSAVNPYVTNTDPRLTGGGAYAPAVPANWLPPPATISGALDQLAARGYILTWGCPLIGTTGGARFLNPGFSGIIASTTPLDFRAPRAMKLSKLQVHVGTAGTAAGARTITFTLMVNGVATALSASGSHALVDWSDLVNTVTIAAGDLIGIRSMITGGNLTASPVDVIASLMEGA